MSIEAMKKAVKVIMGFRSNGIGDNYPSYEEAEAVADLRIAINKAENPENFLDAIDRAYHEGKKAGIAEANAVNDVAKTEQKHNFCSDCGKFMPKGGIHTCSSQVKQQFYPDWDMIKPLTERIAELEAQLHELGKGCAECGKKESDGWALCCVECVECVEKASKPEQEPVAWVRDLTSPQPHCVTSLKYRSVADTDAGVKYIPVYAAPPSKPWASLTDEEIYLATNNIDRNERGWAVKFARAIEAKLKEKNSG